MERKIGEIFEYNGEWYQCVGGTCRNCRFYYDTVCKNITTIGSTNFGNCHCSLRTDHKSVIFKKLEKVGEPMKIHNRLVLKVKADAYKCMRCCFYSKGKCELTMQVGVWNTRITQVCNGKRKQCKGYIWKWANDEPVELKEE